MLAEKRKQEALQKKKDEEQKQVSEEKKEIDSRIRYWIHIDYSLKALILNKTNSFYACFKIFQSSNIIHLYIT